MNTAGITSSNLQRMGHVPGSSPVLNGFTAKRAVQAWEGLAEGDRAQFQRLLRSEKSQVARAFLWKALAAGRTLPDVAAFAPKLKGMYDQELIATLTLRDAGPSASGARFAVAQQFEMACATGVAEVLRGEADPIYALDVRMANQDVHEFADPLKNAKLRSEEKDFLERFGGVATPRGIKGGKGIGPYGLWNLMSPYTGETYTESDLPDVNSPKDRSDAWSAVCAQVEQGIVTPISTTVPDTSRGHGNLVVDIRGEGKDQDLLIYDPLRGSTDWAPRAALEAGTYDFTGTGINRLWDYAKAQPVVAPPSGGPQATPA